MCARAPNGLRTFLELRYSEPGTPKRGCSYRRVLCARPAGEAERGLSGSVSDSLACHSPFKPRDHILGGLVCTHANILPSGAMNRSYRVPSVSLTVPVQSALTVYVPENLTFLVMLRL